MVSDSLTWRVDMTVTFRGIAVREGMLLRGEQGWGEWSPFLDYDGAELVPWLRAAIEAANDPWPAPRRDKVPVNVTVPAVAPHRAEEIVARSGCRTAKVKVAETGQSLDDDLARVAAVRGVLGPAGSVRVDANGAWEVEQAFHALKDLNAHDLEYAEQPCATVEELAELRRRLAKAGIDVPIAADESIRRSGDPERVVALAAADVAVLKVQPLGGVAACLKLAERLGLPVVVSSALETSVGLAAGVVLAAALPELPFACGLDTGRLLAADVVDQPLVAIDGQHDVATAHRVRTVADPHRQVLASDEVAGRWAERLAATSELVGSGA